MSLNTYPYNPFPASTDKLDEAHNAELQQEVDQLKEDTRELREDVEKLETDKTDTAVIAPEFDAEAGVYAVGDLVIYQGKLYEFTTAHETAGDWDSTEVTEKTVADEIDTVKSGLNNKQDTLLQTGFFNTATGSIETGIAMQKFISAYAANWENAYCYVRRKPNNTAIIDVKDTNGNVITNTSMSVVVNYLP